jgi:hypothetical protein
MAALFDTLDACIAFLNTPGLRAVTLVFSAISLLVSYMAFRRTSHALQVQKSNVMADHARHLETQWQTLYRLTITNPEFARQVASMYGMTEDDVRHDAAFTKI